MQETPARILVVDDEEAIRRLLSVHLCAQGYSVLLAADGAEALQVLDTQPVELILSDVRMPGIDGMQLLKTVTERGDATAVVLLTACEDLPMAVDAMKSGALDYLVKPMGLPQVSEAVKRALARREVILAEKLMMLEQSLEVQSFSDRFREASLATLELLVAVLDERERETMCHSKRVSEFAVHLGRVMRLSEEECDVLARGALLHDVGKIAIPDAILRKPTALTEAERREMMRHPEVGYRLLQSVSNLRASAEIVLGHHSNFDGSGYPVTWAGERIPLGARIFSVVDTFDAMTSDRPYRRALSYYEASEEISRCAGTQFDPAVVTAFHSVPPAAWEEIRRSISGAHGQTALPSGDKISK